MEDTYLGTRFRIRWVDSTASTNSDVAAAAAAGEREGLVIAADFQTAGRGRLGRTWTAPVGSALLCSFLLRPPASGMHLAVTAVGCAAAAAVGRLGVDAGMKWPNDMVLETPGGGRKLAGILAEAVTEGDRVTGVVVGLGLNLVQAPDFPPELEAIATSLDRFGVAVDRRELLGTICAELESRIDRPAEVMAEYRRRCVTLGQQVRVEQPGSSWEGTATQINDDGSLLVRTERDTRRVDAGDVIHLRPAGES